MIQRGYREFEIVYEYRKGSDVKQKKSYSIFPPTHYIEKSQSKEIEQFIRKF